MSIDEGGFSLILFNRQNIKLLVLNVLKGKGLAMLKLDRVSKFYSTNGVVTAGFSKVSLDFELGEFVAITGESGSGKSTLLNVISGLDSYEEGEMYIFGQPTSGYGKSDMEEYRKRYIGNIFQTFNLINHYTVYENVELVLLLAGYEANEIKERVDDIIQKVGLEEYKNTKTSKLSGGQKQRVAIARALAKETPIIVADEPTGNLDVASASEIIKLLASLSKDKLIIIVTHNYEQVEPYVTRKISMHDGRIAEDKRFKKGEQPVRQTGEEKDELPSEYVIKETENIINNQPGEIAGEEGLPSDSVPAVKEARQGKLSKGNTVRLGARNAFSLPAKFLLLLFVFFFLTTGTFATYSNYVGMKKGISNSSWGYIFNNTSSSRVILTKEDNSVFNESDYEKIKAIENIDFLETNDILMDSSFDITNAPKSLLYGMGGDGDNVIYSDDGTETVYVDGEELEITFWERAVAAGMDFISEDRELVKGRLPETKDEALLLIEEGGFIDDNRIEDMFEKTGYVESNNANFPSDGMKVPLKIVGIGYYTEEEIEKRMKSHMWYDITMVMTSEGLNRIEALPLVGTCITELRVGTNILSVGPPPWSDIWLVSDSKVERGTVVVPATIASSLLPNSAGGMGMFDLTKMQVELRTRSKYFDRKVKFNISGKDETDTRIHIHPDDLWEMYMPSDKYQVTAMLSSDLYNVETRAALEEAGYETLYLNETADKQSAIEKALMGAMRIIVVVLLLGVLFFVVYFITKLIMKSQNVYYSTVRMLGGNEDACSGTLLAELLVVFHIAFLFCLAVLIKVRIFGSVIMPAYFVRLVRYIEPFDYVILYIVVLLMTLLLAYRYSSQMFKKTAMNAYREEV